MCSTACHGHADTYYLLFSVTAKSKRFASSKDRLSTSFVQQRALNPTVSTAARNILSFIVIPNELSGTSWTTSMIQIRLP